MQRAYSSATTIENPNFLSKYCNLFMIYMSVWIERSFISQEDDDLFPADGRAALDKLSEEDEDYSEVRIFSVEKNNTWETWLL